MSHEYIPCGNSISDEAVRLMREENYSPDKLYDYDSKVMGDAINAIDNLMASSYYGRSFITNDDAITQVHSYERVLSDAETYVHVRVDNRISVKSRFRREEYDAYLDYYDTEQNYLFGTAYHINKFASGIAAMMIHNSIDGVASALRHEDPAFLSAISWQEATPYDAANLCAKLEELLVRQNELQSKEHDVSNFVQTYEALFQV